ncbi:MAG: bifunctional adenosylcobinamide kinase/adenosylcobinamide-phosphate guanylyltransferase, partial [Actinomycetes bacterium]
MSRILVLGGSRSGKSAHAERLLADRPDVTYLATSVPPDGDAEWAARVAVHRARRPASWTTVETTAPADLVRGGAVLVDSVTTWVAALLDDSGTWTEESGATERLDARCDALVEAWTS